jgi:hypothetical protein
MDTRIFLHKDFWAISFSDARIMWVATVNTPAESARKLQCFDAMVGTLP